MWCNFLAVCHPWFEHCTHHYHNDNLCNNCRHFHLYFDHRYYCHKNNHGDMMCSFHPCLVHKHHCRTNNPPSMMHSFHLHHMCCCHRNNHSHITILFLHGWVHIGYLHRTDSQQNNFDYSLWVVHKHRFHCKDNLEDNNLRYLRPIVCHKCHYHSDNHEHSWLNFLLEQLHIGCCCYN